MATELVMVAETDTKLAEPGWQPFDGTGGALAAATVQTRSPHRSAPHPTLLVAAAESDLVLPHTPARAHVYRPLCDWIGRSESLAEPWREVLFYVLTWPVPGSDAEFNEWYTNQHLADVIDVDGFVAARRYEPIGHARHPEPDPRHYLALYLMKGDPSAALDALAEAKARGRMKISPALGRSEAYVYEPVAR
jgi:hypothetical protein